MLIVDPATGAMYKLDTTPINVTLQRGESTVQNKGKENPSFSIVNIKDVPEDVKQYLVKVN